MRRQIGRSGTERRRRLVVEGSLAADFKQLLTETDDETDEDDDARPAQAPDALARAHDLDPAAEQGGAQPRARAVSRRWTTGGRKTRGDCAEMERPCPFVACKYHLYIDVHPVRGSIKINFPDVEVWEMTDTCALDIADRGGITLEEVGQIMNLTRERVRQLETQGLAKLQEVAGIDRLHDYVSM